MGSTTCVVARASALCRPATAAATTTHAALVVTSSRAAFWTERARSGQHATFSSSLSPSPQPRSSAAVASASADAPATTSASAASGPASADLAAALLLRDAALPPNAVSLARFATAPIVGLLLSTPHHLWPWGAAALAASAASDWADGALARWGGADDAPAWVRRR